MKAKPKACSQCNKTFWTKLDHEIRCGRCRAKLLRKQTAHVISTPLYERIANDNSPPRELPRLKRLLKDSA